MTPRCDFFLVGAQKAATTWLHRCFREHPDVYVPRDDEVHFFDIHHHRGQAWYAARHFVEYNGQRRVGETTSSYLRDPAAMERIAAFNPQARIILSIRNPIDRAFSHYWHEKKKGAIAFDFEAWLNNFDLYQNWIEPGFYDVHLATIHRLFAPRQVLTLIYDDLISDPAAFIRSAFEFLGVDAAFRPSVLHTTVNKAGVKIEPDRGKRVRLLDRALEPARLLLPRFVRAGLRRRLLGGRYVNELSKPIESEYDRGMSDVMRAELAAIYRPHVGRLSSMIGRDLMHWVDDRDSQREQPDDRAVREAA